MRHSSLLKNATCAGLLTILLGSMSGACLNRPIDRLDPNTTSTVVERLRTNSVDKIDILLAIDNSSSMKDKQEILATAVPALIRRLIEPPCLDLATGAPTGVTVDAKGECPDGSEPEFPAIRDINVGVISSSLGAMTNSICNGAENPDDNGMLVVRGIPVEETYQGLGFLAWDPDNKRGGDADIDHLTTQLGQMVRGVEQKGCGFEMQLESIHRFLSDPEPYASLQPEGDGIVKVGVNGDLLAQREAFLRPDSLVAVLLLSDENDCSFDPAQQPNQLLAGADDGPGGFFKGTSECLDDPADACCQSCYGHDDNCDVGGNCSASIYTADEDPGDLKCWQQKERYGYDFLYPVQRYVNAFTQKQIDPTRADLAALDPDKAVPNPLFVGTDGSTRQQDRVFVAGIVGVPWQAVAKDKADLAQGFKEYDDLAEDLPALIGDPDAYVQPTEIFMRESTTPRNGTSSLLGESLPGQNPINGNEYTPDDPADSLQFACIFPLPVSIPDSDPDAKDCDVCANGPCDVPLCNGGEQIMGKAVPSLRELGVLAGMQAQGIFASICAENTTGDTTAPDYGYNPAVSTIIERLKEKLGGQCLSRKLTPDDEGLVQCLVIEAYTADSCDCSADIGRAEITPELEGKPNPKYNAVKLAQEDPVAGDDSWNCFCEIKQLTQEQPAEREACLNDLDPASDAQGDGWCYIDGASLPPVGNKDLIPETCAESEQRVMRFVGDAEPRPNATAFITCAGE